MSLEKAELKARLEAKKTELEARIAKLKADSIGGANETLGKLQDKLTSLEGDLQQGWDNMTEAAASKLNRWLSDKE
jgi:DNA-binding transcriptional MerR regulator